jgi:hypothetical protein
MTLSALGIFSAAGAGGVVAAGDYELIESSILTGTTGSITFSSLGTYSSTYKHLQVRVAGRSTDSAVLTGIRIRLGNGSPDAGTNYSTHQLQGYNGTFSSGAQINQTWVFCTNVAGANAGSSIFGAAVIDILDPFSTTKFKTTRALGGTSAGTGTNAAIEFGSGNWRSTSSVTDVQVIPSSGSWATGSRFSLYGIKG